MNRTVLIIGLLLLVPLLLVLRVGFENDDPATEFFSPLVGKPAPSFVLADTDGRVWSLRDLRGKPVVINFWATYCAPCWEEHPLFMAASEHYGDDVQFLGIIYQDDPALIEEFERQRGSWGPALVDTEGEVAVAYGVYGPPETYFIGKDGVIVDKVIGAVSGEVMQRRLEEML